MQEKDPATPVISVLPEVDPALRDTADPDPIVEEMVQRLRTTLQGMVALDEFGRAVPWRQVVRLALGPSLDRLRTEAEGQVIVLPADEVSSR